MSSSSTSTQIDRPPLPSSGRLYTSNGRWSSLLIEAYLYFIYSHNRGRRKNTPSCGVVADMSVNEDGGSTPCPQPTRVFLREKYAECSETEKFVFWRQILRNIFIWACLLHKYVNWNHLQRRIGNFFLGIIGRIFFINFYQHLTF